MGICCSDNEYNNNNSNTNNFNKDGENINIVDPLNKYSKSICEIKLGNEQEIGFLLKFKIVQKKAKKKYIVY